MGYNSEPQDIEGQALAIRQFLGGREKIFLPKLMEHNDLGDFAQYVGGVMRTIKNAPLRSGKNKLLEAAYANPQSVENACLSAITLGLHVDDRQHGYLVPYAGKVTFQIGWRGYVHAIKRAFPDFNVVVKLAFDGDVVEIDGSPLNETVNHKRANVFADKWEELMGGYAYMTWTDETGNRLSAVETMSADEIKKIRGCAKSTDIWSQWPMEQTKKSIIRRACKTLFAHIVRDMDLEDNTNYDLDKRPEPKEFDIGDNGALVDITPEETETEQDGPSLVMEVEAAEEVVTHLHKRDFGLNDLEIDLSTLEDMTERAVMNYSSTQDEEIATTISERIVVEGDKITLTKDEWQDLYRIGY